MQCPISWDVKSQLGGICELPILGVRAGASDDAADGALDEQREVGWDRVSRALNVLLGGSGEDVLHRLVASSLEARRHMLNQFRCERSWR